MKALIAAAALLILTGCETISSQSRPDSYYPQASSNDNGSDLFTTGELLSDADIERILNYRIKLPEKSRVAILKLSSDNHWRNYSNEFTQLNDSLAKNLVGTLLNSESIYDASFLPSMLVPNTRTIPYLREAAARYQADLLFVYRSNCNSFHKYRFLADDEFKAYCDVEAAVLDIRKGIVPFTSISTNTYDASKHADDKNNLETQKKAELEAISKSLGEIASDLVAYLN